MSDQEIKIEPDHLLKKLWFIQTRLKVPKSEYNEFARFNYRTCEDILAAYKNVSFGTTLKVNNEIVMVGERYYVKATATLMDNDHPDQGIVATAYAREPLNKKGMDEAQVTGTASTYATKRALGNLFLLDDTKDLDVSSGAPEKVIQPKAVQPPQGLDVLRKLVWEKTKQCTDTEAVSEVLKRLGIKELAEIKDIPTDSIGQCISVVRELK